MPTRTTHRSLVWSFLLVIAAACASNIAPDEERIVLEVAPQRMPCRGEAVRQCLRVRRDGAAEWTLFYDDIAGFTFQEGVSFRLEVARRRVPNPPADGSSFAWRLIRVLSRQPGS